MKCLHPQHGRRVLLPFVLVLLPAHQHQSHVDAMSQQREGTASGVKEGKNSAMVPKREGAETEYIPPNSCQRMTRMKKRSTPLKEGTVLHCSEIQVHGKVLLAALCSEDEHIIPCDWPVHAH